MKMLTRSLDEVIGEAEAQGTPILMEIYAPWCPYCQRMQKTVYSDSTVRAYLDRTFTYARLNRDTTAGSHQLSGRTLSSKQLGMVLGARGMPTTVFSEGGWDAHCQPARIPQAGHLPPVDPVRRLGGPRESLF
jgi:thioredoxin-related protein